MLSLQELTIKTQLKEIMKSIDKLGQQAFQLDLKVAHMFIDKLANKIIDIKSGYGNDQYIDNLNIEELCSYIHYDHSVYGDSEVYSKNLNKIVSYNPILLKYLDINILLDNNIIYNDVSKSLGQLLDGLNLTINSRPKLNVYKGEKYYIFDFSETKVH